MRHDREKRLNCVGRGTICGVKYTFLSLFPDFQTRQQAIKNTHVIDLLYLACFSSPFGFLFQQRYSAVFSPVDKEVLLWYWEGNTSNSSLKYLLNTLGLLIPT